MRNIRAVPPPDLGIPASDCTVKVSIIDTTTRISGLHVSILHEPQIGAYTEVKCPAYSFLVENEAKSQKVLFDLGVPLHWDKVYPLQVANRIKEKGWSVNVKQGVSDILTENGIELDSINAIIWSHYHWDHIGDPSIFPGNTTLVVGPGFKAEFVPGYPTNSLSKVHESAFAGREVREIEFGPDLRLGKFKAYDYFGDGSFYLLDSPGHAVGHLCALARTTAGEQPTFIFMAGDASHHGGEFRPTEWLPLPHEVRPHPLREASASGAYFCPGELFVNLHPEKSATTPYLQPTSGPDLEECKRTIRKMEEFDAHEHILCLMAHDATMLDIVDFFPTTANEWKAKGWKPMGQWRFLGDFFTDDKKKTLLDQHNGN